MSNFWNEPVEQVMRMNGTTAAFLLAQQDEHEARLTQMHDLGMCDGGAGEDRRYVCPVCSLRLKAAHAVRIRSDVLRRNARLTTKVAT